MMNKQIALFEVIQDFLVSLTLTLAALLVSKQNITGLLLLTETVFAWIVNLVIGFTVPQKKICDRVCAKLKLKKHTFQTYIRLLNSLTCINMQQIITI